MSLEFQLVWSRALALQQALSNGRASASEALGSIFSKQFNLLVYLGHLPLAASRLP